MASNLAYRRWVVKQVEDAKRHLNLHEFTIEVTFTDKPHPDDDDDGSYTMASVGVLSEYLSAKIRVYPALYEKEFKRGEYRRAATALYHEVCHIVTWDLWLLAACSMSNVTREHYIATMERLTERLCQVAIRSIPKKAFNP